jgi:hypothetical protein
VNWQTDEDGRVFYGKPITYGWIQRKFPGSKLRNLERWTARLRAAGYIATKRYQHGFTVRVLNQKKWPVHQMSLFHGEPVCISSGKRAEVGAQNVTTSATSGGARAAITGDSAPSVSISCNREVKQRKA